MRWLTLAVGLVALGGCSRAGQLYPLHQKAKWTYTVKAGVSETVQTLQVVRTVPVASEEGFELAGPTGVSHLVWKRGVLWTTRLPQMKVNPPLPLLVEGQTKAQRTWSGNVWHAGKLEKGTAMLTQTLDEEYRWKGSEVKATNVVIKLELPGRTVELNTWYLPHLGPISQTQRTNGRFDLGMEYLSGP